MSKTLLLTGGTGYIGSHAAVAFQEAGYRVILLDNLCNSSAATVDAIGRTTGTKPGFYEGDIRNGDFLDRVFASESIDAVVHFAGLKAVGESCGKPFLYHDNNIAGSMALFAAMQKHGCRSIVFSSSATVHDPKHAPLFTEETPTATTSPYGTTKLVVEKLLGDLADFSGWNVVNLRYFNPIGAHPSGHIGERPNGIPNNLLPYIFDVAAGKREKVRIFGNDYPTPDGTGIRDYIDVNDLADAHVLAYEKMASGIFGESGGVKTVNIGTGRGTSVLEMIRHAEKVIGHPIAYEYLPRRSGDIAEFYTSARVAREWLGWSPKRSVEDAVRSGWNFIVSQT